MTQYRFSSWSRTVQNRTFVSSFFMFVSSLVCVMCFSNTYLHAADSETSHVSLIDSNNPFAKLDTSDALADWSLSQLDVTDPGIPGLSPSAVEIADTDSVTPRNVDEGIEVPNRPSFDEPVPISNISAEPLETNPTLIPNVNDTSNIDRNLATKFARSDELSPRTDSAQVEPAAVGREYQNMVSPAAGLHKNLNDSHGMTIWINIPGNCNGAVDNSSDRIQPLQSEALMQDEPGSVNTPEGEVAQGIDANVSNIENADSKMLIKGEPALLESAQPFVQNTQLYDFASDHFAKDSITNNIGSEDRHHLAKDPMADNIDSVNRHHEGDSAGFPEIGDKQIHDVLVKSSHDITNNSDDKENEVCNLMMFITGESVLPESVQDSPTDTESEITPSGDAMNDDSRHYTGNDENQSNTKQLHEHYAARSEDIIENMEQAFETVDFNVPNGQGPGTSHDSQVASEQMEDHVASSGDAALDALSYRSSESILEDVHTHSHPLGHSGEIAENVDENLQRRELHDFGSNELAAQENGHPGERHGDHSNKGNIESVEPSSYVVNSSDGGVPHSDTLSNKEKVLADNRDIVPESKRNNESFFGDLPTDPPSYDSQDISDISYGNRFKQTHGIFGEHSAVPLDNLTRSTPEYYTGDSRGIDSEQSHDSSTNVMDTAAFEYPSERILKDNEVQTSDSTTGHHDTEESLDLDYIDLFGEAHEHEHGTKNKNIVIPLNNGIFLPDDNAFRSKGPLLRDDYAYSLNVTLEKFGGNAASILEWFPAVDRFAKKAASIDVEEDELVIKGIRRCVSEDGLEWSDSLAVRRFYDCHSCLFFQIILPSAYLLSYDDSLEKVRNSELDARFFKAFCRRDISPLIFDTYFIQLYSNLRLLDQQRFYIYLYHYHKSRTSMVPSISCKDLLGELFFSPSAAVTDAAAIPYPRSGCFKYTHDSVSAAGKPYTSKNLEDYNPILEFTQNEGETWEKYSPKMPQIAHKIPGEASMGSQNHWLKISFVFPIILLHAAQLLISHVVI